MQSLQIETNQRAALHAQLKTLLDCQQVCVVSRSGGGNSVVYCVQADGEKLAVKSYPPFAPGKRDRLAAEVMVYQFLNAHDLACVPTLRTYSEADRLLVMDWIEGDIPAAYGANDIQQAIDFIAAVVKLNMDPAAKALPLAAEACLSLSTIILQVSQRLLRLQTATAHEPELKVFLEQEFIPVFLRCQELAIAGYQANGISAGAELPQEKRSLIPADFGFHNAMRDARGQLQFFDFDYFGWDDPVKLLADILWHPKMQLTSQQAQQFIDGLAAVYQHDDLFLPRFHHTLALFGLRWALIFLNEFLPEFWQNRQHAAVHASQAEAKISQLKRARTTLLNVQKRISI